MKQYFSAVAILLSITSCTSNPDKITTDDSTITTPPSVPLISFSATRTLPHDTSLFLEGFLIHDGRLYESTGSPEDLPQTKSLIGPLDTTNGKIQPKVEIDRKDFGEGIVFFKDRLYQLTYKKQTCYVYDAKTFKRAGEYKYDNKEGWSLTHNDSLLIMSDGTDRLTFIDPATFKPVRQIAVTLNGAKRDSLNELEYIKGYIYANIWLNSYIVKIDPSNGKVVGKLDLSSIIADARNRYPDAETLNGIAYDRDKDRVFVTGKLWPAIYELSFSH
ncbi:MAG: glutaminyl-peptide cyclotransferase [Bacteroidetes bacterium]|nr:glutaminyl-peptide cyclotransferase [Bacteroidota bacterium]